MTTNVDLEWVPWEILETVKARILSRRRQLQDAQEQQKKPVALQPKPQFAKFGADSRNWRLPEPAAVGGGGYGWLLVPSGGYDSNLGGFQTIVRGLPQNPFQTTNLVSKDGEFLLPGLENSGDGLQASGFGDYSTGSTTLPLSLFDQFTFEGYIVANGAPSYTPGAFYFGGFWYWEYDVYTEVLGNNVLQTYQLLTTDPSGIARPIAPSIYLADSDLFDGVVGPGNQEFVAERGPIYTTQPENQTVPAYLVASTVFKVAILDAESNPIKEYAFSAGREIYTGVPAENSPAYDRVTFGFTATETSADASVNAAPTALDTVQHLAIVKTRDTIAGYVNGNRVFNAPLNIAATSTSNIICKIEVIHGGPLDGPIIRDPTPALPDRIDNRGNITAADAMRHKIKGIRLTPGRALYSGESFNPPTSITTLA